MAPVTNLVAPVSDVVALIQDMLTPVAGAVVPLTQLQSDLFSFLLGIAGVAPVPNLVAAVSDVIALIQDMLTSVAGAVVPLTQLQSDLYSFLLGIAGVQPVVAGLGGVAGAGLSPAADASVASQWRLVLSLAGIPGGPLAGNAPGVATLGRLAASIFGATTQVAPNGAIPMGMQSFFRHADSELLLPGSLSALPGAAGLAILTAAGVLPVSLAALAAVALPGVGGLVILTASRGARRIPPGQSRFRIADSGHRALRPSGGRSVRCRPFGVIGCRPSEGIARRPSGGVKRRMSSR